MLDLKLQFVCTRKPGTLSRAIREISLVGLHYQNHQIHEGGDHIRFTIHASGEPNCSLSSLEGLFVDFPEVTGAVQVSATRDGKPVSAVKTQISESRLDAGDGLTPAVVLAAEKRLSDILGPVASVIVEAVVGNCGNVGELYTRLAAELNDDEERTRFLSVLVRDG